jgi:uroporphyrinogen III methyltransferase/synthase
VIRVALTRAAGGNDELARRLTAAGLEPVECPLIAIEPLPGPPLDLDPYDWLVLTSRHGAEALAARGRSGEARVAAIGPGTAAAAREHGLEPELVPEVSTQEGLVAAFPADPGRVLFAGAEDARDHLPRELGADVVPLYRTVPLAPDPFPSAGLVVLASASATAAFAALGLRTPAVSIGPVTSAAAREAGLTVLAEAETHDLDGLERAVRVAASSIASSPS